MYSPDSVTGLPVPVLLVPVELLDLMDNLLPPVMLLGRLADDRTQGFKKKEKSPDWLAHWLTGGRVRAGSTTV